MKPPPQKYVAKFEVVAPVHFLGALLEIFVKRCTRTTPMELFLPDCETSFGKVVFLEGPSSVR